jgi:hypothetical protein
MEEQINLLDYSYPDGTMVEIPGRLLEGLIQILNTVNEKETTKGFIDKYPVSIKEIFNKDKEDFLEDVKVEWKGFTTAQAYFNQDPQEVKTLLGAMALDLCLLLKQGHLENIKAGIAVERGSFEIPQENEKEGIQLSQQ